MARKEHKGCWGAKLLFSTRAVVRWDLLYNNSISCAFMFCIFLIMYYISNKGFLKNPSVEFFY